METRKGKKGIVGTYGEGAVGYGRGNGQGVGDRVRALGQRKGMGGRKKKRDQGDNK